MSNQVMLRPFTGPPVPLTARMRSTPQRPFCRMKKSYYVTSETNDAWYRCLWSAARCAPTRHVGWLLQRGEQGSAAPLLPALMRSLRVLVYNGEYDMDCNFVGTP
eukprot:2265020-Pyramimonas_sp.AAC.1